MAFPAASGRLPPGCRFHPTDVELVMHYLKRKVMGKRLEPGLVAEVDIYQFHPEDLRERAYLNKDLNWYFFCARGKKKKKNYACGDRTNRATRSGYWKVTGRPRSVLYRQRTVGKVKILVYYSGKPAKRTDWVMHEYTLEDTELDNKDISDAYVICKIFKKGGVGRSYGEQYYNEEEWDEEEIPNNAPMVVNGSFSDQVCPQKTSVRVCSGAVSVSISDQAPTPTSNGSNVASTSKVVAPDTYDDVDQKHVPTSNVADIGSSSKFSVQNDGDDIDRLLSRFHGDDFGCICECDNLDDPVLNLQISPRHRELGNGG